MARKPAINLEKLMELGPERLAQLVLDQAGREPSFRKRVSAALAAMKGPDSVARIVDRRLGALEKARSFIDWDKERTFRDDLSATLATAGEDLGKLAPAMAVDRLLRFIATHESVFNRIDDSSGRIQDVYYQAIAQAGELAAKLTPDEKAQLPGKIMAALGHTDHGYLVEVAQAVVEHLPKDVAKDWEGELADLQAEQEAQDAKSKDRFVFSNAGQYRDIRQIIADTLGDLDGMIALEKNKHPNLQDTIGIAERLLEAGRQEEALDWVRRQREDGLKFMSLTDLADGLTPRLASSSRRTSLEAQILDALGNTDEAQALRWSWFEATHDPDMLRAYIDALPDFGEFEAMDRACNLVLSSDQIYSALRFFTEWPKLDLAAQKVLAHRGSWDGGQYYLLPPIAETLLHDHPLAATILYRALIDDILAKGRSTAYPHAARYLHTLDALASASDAEASGLEGFLSHSDYRANLNKKHGRKTSFWARAG